MPHACAPDPADAKRLRRADAALALARMLAWALLIGGWLALAALGRQRLPLLAGGMALPAVWLLGAAAALALAGRRRWSPRAQAGLALGMAGAAAWAAGMAGGAMPGTPTTWLSGLVPTRPGAHPAVAITALALAWGALLAAAATTVRGLRLARAEIASRLPGQAAVRSALPAQPALPTGPAAAGALLAWAVFGGAAADDAPRTLLAAAWALPLAALALAVLALHAGRGASTCRSGLFDCAWPTLSLAALRQPAQWSPSAAGLAMLPMMAALPWMAQWCGRPGAGPAEVAGQHLAAMLLPALLGRALPAVPGPLQRHGVSGLLMLGGLALLGWPGRDGLAAAAIAQGMAWGLAWRQRLTGKTRPAAPPTAQAGAWSLALSALVLLLFGLALASFGPQALVAVHGALALVAAAGVVAMRLKRLRHEKSGPQAALPPLRTPFGGLR